MSERRPDDAGAGPSTSDDTIDAPGGRFTTDERRSGPEGRGTNVGAVEYADEQVGDEGAPNYKSAPKKASQAPDEVDYDDAHESDEDARGQGGETYEAGEGNSESIEDSVEEENGLVEDADTADADGQE